LNLLRKYFVDNKSATVRTIPSIAEKEKLAKEEADRLESRRQELGEDGLATKAKELDEAMAEKLKQLQSQSEVNQRRFQQAKLS